MTTNRTYTFTVSGPETFTVEYNTIIDNKAKIVFKSWYGQVKAQGQFAEDATMELPALPTRNGFTTIGWDCDGDGAYDAEKDTFTAAVSRGLAADDRTVTVLAVYELKPENYTITGNNGTGGGVYAQNQKVVVNANAAEAGKKFSHWEDSDGNALGYETRYTFYALKHMTLTAQFVDEATVVEPVGTTMIESITRDEANHKLTFVSISTVPDGCSIVKAGVIATDNETVANSGYGFNDSTARFVRAGTTSGKLLECSWTKTKVNTGDIWYARAYLVYADANGNTHTLYGDKVTFTFWQ